MRITQTEASLHCHSVERTSIERRQPDTIRFRVAASGYESEIVHARHLMVVLPEGETETTSDARLLGHSRWTPQRDSRRDLLSGIHETSKQVSDCRCRTPARGSISWFWRAPEPPTKGGPKWLI